MAKLVLLRHGQSTWNLENKFTGWIDIPLTPQGIVEAREAGAKIKVAGIHFDEAYTSVLQRAIDTLTLCLEAMGQENIPVFKDQALNERHYGDLQGLDKADTAARYGDEQVLIWRRSYDISPPRGESLKQTAERVLPYFNSKIIPSLKSGNDVLISAHGNSLRAIVMVLDRLNEKEVVALNIPNGVPIVYDVNANGEVEKKVEL